MNNYQLDLFCDSDNLYKIKKPIRLIEFFAGVGFQRMGIEKVFPDMQSWKICEWAVPSIIAYDVIHSKNRDNSQCNMTKDEMIEFLFNKGISVDYNVPAEKKQIQKMPLEKLISLSLSIIRTNNLVNIMNVKGSDLDIMDTDKYEYVVTYSFPCQDLSLAGDKKGMSVSQKEGGTRSGLVWELLRIIKECENKPQILLMENVPQVHSKDNNGDFYYLQCELQKLGYKNFWQDMNGKNYGIPQNRNRTFMISILDKNCDYVFPEPEPLKLKLKDLLEENVDEKYYLSEKMIDYIVANNEKWTGNNAKSLVNKSIASTLNTGEGSKRCDASNYELIEDEREREEDLDLKTIIPNKDSMIIKNANSKGYLEAHDGDGIDISTRMETHRGTVQKGICQTLKTQTDVGVCVDDKQT